ncbi:MAG: transposase [Gammaproteobacteria bacterium]|nr:transposase [Gammaproteobacteria bacterium]
MPRPLRIEYPGAWYHVFSMTARRRPVFKTEEHRDLFLDVVHQTAETYGVEVHGYCVVPDQYHLLIRTPRANLSRTMRQLNGVFTQRCNKRFGGKGQVFRGRYKAVLIDDANFLGATARYIHTVPVATEQATRPDQYQWSSCRAQVGGIKAPSWLHTKSLAKVGGMTYAKFLAQGVDEETQHFYARKHIEAVRGDTAFRKTAKASVKSMPKKGGKPSGNVPALPEIYKQVADAFKVKPDHLQLSFRGRSQGNLPRQVAMALARSPGGYSLLAIAKSLQVGHYSSVSVAAARLKKKLETDEPLQRKVDRLKTQLFKV